jgi:hypothetical protein
MLVDQLKAALAHDDDERLRIVVELIGQAIDTARGDRQGTEAARNAYIRFGQRHPSMTACVGAELGRLAELAELCKAG